MNHCVTIVTIVTISFLVTGVQNQNVAILAKFSNEMANLAERKKSWIGKLTLKTSLIRVVTYQNLTQGHFTIDSCYYIVLCTLL